MNFIGSKCNKNGLLHMFIKIEMKIKQKYESNITGMK